MSKKYDVIIIGAGPAGMTAALYASRANLNVLMLDRGIYGGKLVNTDEIENYPGFEGIKGPDLAKKIYDTAMQFKPDFEYGDVQNVEVQKGTKIVTTDSGVFEAPVLIVATGSESKLIGVPGEDEYSGRGVSYCAVCDGAFFKDDPIVVIGGGDSALDEGLYLSRLGKSVTILQHNKHLKALPILVDRVKKNDKMNVIYDACVDEILGDGQKVTGVKYHDAETDEEKTIPASGVFIYVGSKPMTDMVADLGITNEKGWIPTNENMETKIPGVYAIGDVREKDLRQVANAVGDGSIAGQEAYNYIEAMNS